MATVNLLLHPVRMRILQTLVGAGELTTAQLRERLPDVSPASMYRHVATLTQAGILEVVHERPVRGTVERSYRVRQDEALVDEEARAGMTKDDHRQAFTVFTGAMMADLDRYLSRDDADPPHEGVLYRQGAVWVTPEEFPGLVEELEELVARRTGHTPGDGRIRHIVSLALVPDKTTGGGHQAP
ncbi:MULTISPECIES: helix-turn-helix domain-containing protein [Streptomyces]|uniref:Helix-turn-helix domain-containing protein n=1 Tax=Streptomyces flavovirens TaxID=52258 RepID=A0ABV8N2H7_9ACTN|nr:helix-turn-helix domain-containing protein [Streptomyces sp. MBT51]MBK3594677.1 helix-turn-helix domain-containing protein [Streptomyces sp. MBT51]HBF85211.1 ArsR family transcriptional regulator [Streptomyces sp.]